MILTIVHFLLYYINSVPFIADKVVFCLLPQLHFQFETGENQTV